MPGKVKVKIVAGRNLPVMDRSADTTDAYVEIKLGNTTYKTDVCRKSLNPQWSSEWYRFEVDDSELQDEPLQIRLMDYDVYSANDAIGKVYLDLNPLLLSSGSTINLSGPRLETTEPSPLNTSSNCLSNGIGGSSFAGWVPVFDTMHGIRGEVNLIVKVELFSDTNKFRQSSCGVQFFCSPNIPYGYQAQVIHGFVEELVVNDDPEYQWIDKIRTPRASNEARQTLFFKLSGEVQRRIGLKVLEIGGNAVIGYQKCFDLEGESGIVVRGIGTAVTLIRQRECPPSSTSEDDGLAHYAPTLSRPSSCSCLLRPSSSNTSMHSDRSRSRNLSLGLAASFNTPPFLLVIPPTPTGSLGVSSTGVWTKSSSKHHYSKVFHSPSTADRIPFLSIPHYKSSQQVVSGDGLSRSYKRHNSYSEAVKSDSSPSPIGHSSTYQPTKRIHRFTMLAKSIKYAFSKKIVKTFHKKLSPQTFSKTTKNEAIFSNFSRLKHRRSSSDPTPALGAQINLLRRLDAVDEEVSASSSLDAPLRGAQSDSCLVPSGSISSNEPSSSPSVDRFLASSSSSSISSTSTHSSKSSDLALGESASDFQSIRRKKRLVVNAAKLQVPIKIKTKNNDTSEPASTLLLVNKNQEDESSKHAVEEMTTSQSKTSSLRQAEECIKKINYKQQANLSLPHSLSNNYDNSSLQLMPIVSNACTLAASATFPPISLACNLTDINHHVVSSCPSSPNSVTSSCPSRLPFPAVPGSGSNNCVDEHHGGTATTPTAHCVLANKLSPARLITGNSGGMHRRSSDSDLSITPKGSSLGGSSGSAHNRHTAAHPLGLPRSHLNQESSLDMMEYPFLTMAKYPPGFILRLGGMVSSRSVKLLERTTNTEDHESRDTWWNELRMEVRSHARALACNVVLGYKEQSSICEDVCVLSASGTAAVISLHHNIGMKELNVGKETDQTDVQAVEEKAPSRPRIAADYKEETSPPCAMCHVPYSTSNAPMPVTMLKCASCRQGKVPDVLITTIEPPEGLLITGRGCLVQAHVFRPKKDCRGELNAKEISDHLPFLEYELHRNLINKLRVKGMNSIFNLKVQVSIGERWLVGVATGTAIFLSPMAAPPVPRVAAGEAWSNKAELAEMQKKLQETSKRNREQFCVQPMATSTPLVERQYGESKADSETEESDDDLPELELSVGNKDAFVLEVDDAEDVNVVALLIEPRIPDGFDVVNTEVVPGQSQLEIVCNLQMFTQVWRARMNACQGATSLSKHFHRLQQSLYFKLRKMVPCALCHMDFNVELPEPDEIQITVLGMALGLGELPKHMKSSGRLKKEALKKCDDSDLIFKLDEDTVQSIPCHNQSASSTISLGKGKHTAPRERYGVDITPLSYVPGARIEQYLGNLNFFFIRESTTIRECGGLSGFVHSFVAEVLAIVRAHITALGGNAMVAYFMSECVLLSNSHKNQGQCLINVGGDVVQVTYTEE